MKIKILSKKVAVLAIITILLIGAFIPASTSLRLDTNISNQESDANRNIMVSDDQSRQPGSTDLRNSKDEDFFSNLANSGNTGLPGDSRNKHGSPQVNDGGPLPLNRNGPWWNSNWQYRKEIAIDHTKIDNTLLNFPVLFHNISSDFADHAQVDGDDFVFVANDHTTVYHHEIESYTNGTGELIAWVNITSLSSTTDTTMWLYYGNSSCTSQENPTGVWDSSFAGVWHLNETCAGTGGTHVDSTSNNNNGTTSGGVTTNIAGMISGADQLDGSDDHVAVPHDTSLDIIGEVTASLWVRPERLPFANHEGMIARGSAANRQYWIWGVIAESDISARIGSTTFSGGVSITLQEDTWYNIVLTGDPVGDVILYLNGEEIASNAYGTSPSTETTSLYMGYMDTFGHLAASIDEVRISSIARNSSWINTSFLNQANPTQFISIGGEISRTGEPIVTNPSPADGANSVSISPVLSVLVNDSQGETMNVYFRTNASTGVWHTIGENFSVSNSTVYCANTSEMNQYSTLYWWSVNVTDPAGSGNWTNKTFMFTTMQQPAPWWNTSWIYRKSITIDKDNVVGSLTDFPVLIDIQDADVKNNSQPNGYDIAFTDWYGNQLPHEIEYYNSGTGELIAWVNVSNLTSSEDKVIYLYYGNSGCGNQENVSGVWDSHYVMVHHMDDYTTSSIEDSTAHNNDGAKEAANEPTETDAKIGKGQSFDGSNDHIIVSDDDSLDPSTQITIEAWAYIDSYPGIYPRIIAKDAAVGQQYQFAVHNTNQIFWRIQDGGWRGGDFDTGALSTGSWYYLVGTYDGSILRAYNNGIAQTTTHSHAGTINSGTGDMGIGSKPDDPYGSGFIFDGMIDEIRISNSVLNSSWIETSYNMMNSPDTFITLGIEEGGIDDPVLVNVYPADNALNVELQPRCQVDVNDRNGDPLTVYWYENTSGWTLRQTNNSVTANSTISWVFAQANSIETTYWWSLNATDGTHWTNQTFSFTTLSPAPVLSNPSPYDGETDVVITPGLSIQVNDSQGESMNVYFRTNASTDVWHTIGENLTVTNNTFTCDNTSEMSGYSTTYWWSVNATDGTYWNNQTYHFTTESSPSFSISITYPVQYVVYQRHNDTHGEIFIEGTYAGTPTAIEASLNGGPWSAINATPTGGTFTGSFNATVDQGDLTVRFGNDHGTTDSVSDIGVGDVFVIGGQSNAVGQGSTINTLNSSNPYLATLYRKDDVWRQANDPTDTTGSGSPWVLVADYITQNENIPIAYITTAVSGSSVLEWQPGQGRYDTMISQVSEATHGSMRVRAMFYYQGERDASTSGFGLHGDYDAYYENLSNTASNFVEDTVIATTIVVGQIDNQPSGNRDSIDNIRRAQSDLWDEDANITAGPVTHDIDMTTDNLHFRTDDEIRIFAERWWACIQKVIYGTGDGRGPQLDSIIMIDSDTLQVEFTEDSPPLKVEDYLGNSASEPMGWRIVDGGTILDDTDITTTVISDYEVQLDLNTAISSSANVSLGSYTDGYGNPVIRDNSSFVLPAEPFSSPITDIMDQPHVSNPSPSNGATGVTITPVLSVQVNDSQGDTMDVYFWTNASTGSWHKIGENHSVTNSTVQCGNTSEMGQYSTMYWWSVNVIDSGSGNWTNQTFRFTTESVTVLDPFASGWLYRKTITINHSQVDADLTNFPVLISIVSDIDLMANAQSNGDDILFMNDTGVALRLNHEIEHYNSGTGELICWVNVTHVSSTQDTLIYMYYGNSSCSNQENPNEVWDSNYVMVQHMKDATSSSIADSTSYGNDGSKGAVNEPIETTAKINMGQDFDGSNDYVNCGTDSSLGPTTVTVEGWVNLGSYDPTMDALVQAGSADSYCYELVIYEDELRIYIRDSGSPYFARTSQPSLGEWHYWTGTYDGSTISVYLDGQKGTDASHSGINTDISYLYIGRGYSNYIDSLIDEVRISNIARNASWISTSYNTMNNTDSFISVGNEEVSSDDPYVTNVSPTNGSTNTGLQPTCQIDANDPNGDPLTVYWYENTSGWTLRQTNSSVTANTTVSWIYSQANAYETTYWWSVNITDGTNWTNATYHFTTEAEPAVWWDANWFYRKLITIDHTNVAGNLINFPVIIDIVDTDVKNSSQSNGDDIVFTDYYGNQLNHEIELYDDGTGELVCWVNVTSLSSTQNTLLYMYYGNPGCSNQENPAGVWDSHYLMVHHMKDITTSTLEDSTVNNHDGTKRASGEPAHTSNGILDGAQDFDGSDDYVSIPHDASLNLEDTDFTITAWLNPDTGGAAERFISKRDMSVVEGWHLERESGGTLRCLAWQGASNKVDLIGGSITTGSWHYTVFKRDGDSWYALLDDSIVASTTDSDPIVTTTESVLFGAVSSSSGPTSLFDGLLDEIHISDTSRNSSWLTTEYNNQLNPSTFHSFGSEEASDRPSISNVYPANNAVDIDLQPTCSVDANDGNGDPLTVYWYENTTGWTLRQTNSSVTANSTVTWIYNISDGTQWTNQTFSFTTEVEVITEFDPYSYGWQYRKTITINHSQVPTDLTNFPVLISFSSDTDLTTHAQTNGDDILFMNDAGVATKLHHEIENYSSGTLVAWVNVTYISSTQDTVLYMYYGNPGATNQENVTGVWDSHYMMVQHMNDATSSSITDSTFNNNDGTKHAADHPLESDAKIGRGQDFDYPNQAHIVVSDADSLDPTEITVEGWVYIDSYPGEYPRIFSKDSSAGTQQYQLCAHDTNRIYWRIKDGGTWYGADFDTGAISTGSWIYLVGTYDGTILYAYKNGTAQTTTFTHTGSINSGTGDMSIGARIDDTSDLLGRFDGMMDELRISDIARSSDWIATSFNTMNSPDTFVTIGNEETPTNEPVLTNIYPANNSLDIDIQPTCSIDANDRNGDPLTVYWYENTTGWTLRQTNSSVSANSTVTWIYSQATSYNTMYYWSVNVTDGTHWTNQTLRFKTEFGAPMLSNPSPTDDETGVIVNPILSIQVNDTQGDNMNVYFYTNASTGTWHKIGENLTVTNNTFTCDNTSEMNSYSTMYWWSVNATDTGSGDWVNQTFKFTTEELTVFDPFINGWQYRKIITIDHNNVSGNLTNFPVLISFSSDLDLSAHAQTNGDDILFMNDLGVATKLHHEIEHYDSGTLVAWVNVTYISSTQDTVLYMYYGNPSCISQENPTGVWDSSFAGVWHLNETGAGTGGTHVDSTSNDNDGTTSGGVTTNTVGIIDGADSFDGSDDRVAVPHDTSLDIIGEVTASLWIRPESLPFATPYPGMISRGNVDNRQYWIWGVQGASDIGGRIGNTIAAPGGAGVSLQENNWYHIVITGDPTGDIVMYFDGQEVSRVSYGTQPSTETTSLYMGYMDTLGYFLGSIDEVRVSDVVRNSSWINTSYLNQMNPDLFISVGAEISRTGEPQISNPSPANGAVDVSVSPVLSVLVNDSQGDTMNVYFRTNASTGIWHTISENLTILNSTVRCGNTSEMSSYSIQYWWSVNATDSGSGGWTNMTFSFTTEIEPGAWWNTAWSYRKSITINNTQVTGESPLVNFPVLIDITDSDLQLKAQSTGDDIVFTNYSGTKLNHEIEYYNSGTGVLVAWVNVTLLSDTTDTILYMYYGNPSCTSQENTNGVWDTNYVMIHHLNETSGTHYDSTTYGNDGLPMGGVTQDATGIIDGADDFDGQNDEVECGNDASLNATSGLTMEAWIHMEGDSIVTTHCILGKKFAYELMINDATDELWWALRTPSYWNVNNVGYTVPTDTWVHVTLTYNTTDGVIVYANGLSMDTAPPDGAISTSTEILGIGNRPDTSNFFNGTIDEVRLSNIARSSGWINTSYLNQYNPTAFYSVGSEESSVGEQEYYISLHGYWNLISLPFNESIDKTDIIVRNNSIEYNWSTAVSEGIILNFLYNWTGTAYVHVDTLEPGYGYWSWAYYDCKLIFTSSAEDVENMTSISPGWKIVGLPYNQSLAKEDLIIHYNVTDYSWENATGTNNEIGEPLILGFIYEYNRTAQLYMLSDSYDPGDGYWMYAYEDCVIKRVIV